MRSFGLIVALGCVALGCAKDRAADRGEAPPAAAPTSTPTPAGPRWYRAELTPNGFPPVPLYLEVPSAGGHGKARVRIGGFDTEVDHAWIGGELTLRFGIFPTSITARMEGDELVGEWRSDSKALGVARVPLRATPVASPATGSLFALAGAPRDLAGTWKLELAESGLVHLKLEAVEDGLVASARFAIGSKIRLAGAARGDRLALAGFDGTGLYLIEATLEGDTLRGEWRSSSFGIEWRERFTATRGEFELPAATTLVGALDFPAAAPHLARFKGKPLIVELAASWCIACKEMAPFLHEMYRTYHPRGLEMVTFTYEMTDDAEHNKRRSDDFKRAYAIPWDVVPLDGAPDTIADSFPRNLENASTTGFPLALFVDRAGVVRRVETGFPPPGPEAEAAKRTYEAAIRDLTQ
jgi:thiol-disulfide isomerase/thioredoxin